MSEFWRRIGRRRGACGLPGAAAARRPSQGRLTARSALPMVLGGLIAAAGCAPRPFVIPANQRTPIDRGALQCPTGFTVEPYAKGLSAPTAMAWDSDGTLLVAEGGNYQDEPTILGIKPDGSITTVYPEGRRFPFYLPRPGEFRMYGPIGGMIVHKHRLYVSHRDGDGFGRITAFDFNGNHATIVAHLPAQGDYPVTDMAMDPHSGRLFFGVGSATNSGVVGLDNWEWVRDQPKVRDEPWARMHLRGYRFDSPDPFSGLFGPADIAVTAPLQPFNVSNETEVEASDHPNAAIYSCSPNGGDLRVEAHGIRYPRGLAFNGYSFYFTNEGMELRGTRPVRNDRDALLRLIPGGTWYGWPDYTANLNPVFEGRYQPPVEMIANTGYKRVLWVIDQQQTNQDPRNQEHAVQLLAPSADTLLGGEFAPLSGADKLDFGPSTGPFRQFRGKAVVALSGDRAPFATSGKPIIGPIGYKVVVVDVETKDVKDFITNTAGGPASRIDPKNPNLLERPVDVKFGPDNRLYILDGGRMQVRDGREQWEPGTGKIFRLVPLAAPYFHK